MLVYTICFIGLALLFNSREKPAERVETPREKMLSESIDYLEFYKPNQK